jgi:hypothetical protein
VVGSTGAQPTDSPEPYGVIHLGAARPRPSSPLADLRRLRAVERRASAEAREDAEIEAALGEHDEWVRADRPGARSHDDVVAELLGGY